MRGIQNHGSVEDLIRSTLGNRFIESEVKKSTDTNPEVVPISENFEKQKHSQTQSNQNSKPGDKSQRYPESNIGPINEKNEQVSEFLTATQNFGPNSNFEIGAGRKLTSFEKSLLTSRGDFDSHMSQKEEPSEIRKHTDEYPEESENDFGEIKIKPRPIKKSKEYLFHRDADEVFECGVTVEGGSSEDTTARLVLKTDMWNVFFDGTIKKNGVCSIPLKKLSLFPDGTTGHAYLEIVVDDVVFVPWESPFRITMSKKVSIQTPSLNRR